MIARSPDFDLGLDRARIKDLRDARRQESTVDTVLSRFYDGDPTQQVHLQVVADEVGMGKTFVALAAAYSVLSFMKNGGAHPDLQGCLSKILIVTPQNTALAAKWQREVGEFVRRCVHPDRRQEVATWFRARPVDRWDELVEAVRGRGLAASILVARMSLFQGARYYNYDVKRRFLLGCLFRHWSGAFRNDARERLLKGAPESWPRRPDELGDLSDAERELVPFDWDDVSGALSRKSDARELADDLLMLCKDVAAPFVRDRDQKFREISDKLNGLYTALCVALLRRDFPLVIVDEAHNWKNGPSRGTNGYQHFSTRIAPHTRRALLLTATPFQLRPEEMLELLKISDDLRPTSDGDAADQRCATMKTLREDVIRPVLKNSESASQDFSAAWAKLPSSVTTAALADGWESPSIVRGREELRRVASEPGVIDHVVLTALVNAAVSEVAPETRDLLRQALRLYAYNHDLSSELGRIVVRHRRGTAHRAFLVGAEYVERDRAALLRPDRHVLHGSVGIEVAGEAELPHYLLMRCVSEMKGGKGRTSLGATLTGCYSTLFHSAEGHDANDKLTQNTSGAVYLNLLKELVNEESDPTHPKVAAVVENVVDLWKRGEKALIFCFRTNTASRLHEIISYRVRLELESRQNECLGGAASLRALRARITGRDRDLIGLGLDRVLLSYDWGSEKAADRPLADIEQHLTPEEIADLARLSLKYAVDLTGERIDRVFLNRASEHLFARRLRTQEIADPSWKPLLRAIADERWVTHPYGLDPEGSDDEAEQEQVFDERGVHVVYREAGRPARAQVETLAADLIARRDRALGRSVLDSYFQAPSLWFGRQPGAFGELNGDDDRIVRLIHQFLRSLSTGEGGFDWRTRLLTMQALRRAVLRDSVLLRLLPTRADREESEWGELLVERFFARPLEQAESMAARIHIFLEDLAAASGDITDPGSARYALYDATRLRGEQVVALVHGGTDAPTRERVFAGFNTPIIPDILICTSVGQEGIDLHRHCRHVIHYDLAWNPAVLEQRTGRADRIGSKTFRERDQVRGDGGPYLEVGVPFLAATYDERMYEQLRLRAQTFEVLTGGDLAADNPEGVDPSESGAGDKAPAELRLTVLPDKMVRDLRVSLHVWSDRSALTGGDADTGDAFRAGKIISARNADDLARDEI